MSESNFYAQWRKVDLHVHSDASHDCKLTPKQIVDRMIEKGISLFSITDHNNVDNVDQFRAIVDAKKQDGHLIEFLPGIELRTDRGKDSRAIHLLVIFPEGYTKQMIMDKFLSSEGIKLTETEIMEKGREYLPSETEDIKVYNKGCELRVVIFQKVIEIAKKLPCIIIAAHPKSDAGIENELDYRENNSVTFRELLSDSIKSIDVMELPKNWGKAKNDRSFYLNERNNFIKSMPSILSSDSHELDQIGEKYSWVKMDTCDYNGLIQILFEPKHRVYIDKDSPTFQMPYIKQIKSNGGYYENTEFNFSPELNTIIGSRGSGKSVVIDLIRFVTNKYQNEENEYLDRLYNLLKNSNSVQIQYYDGQGNIKSIEKKLRLEKISENAYSDESEKRDIDLEIDIFNQGKLRDLLNKSSEQLNLLDEIGGLTPLKKEIFLLKNKLIENSNEQIRLIEANLDNFEKFQKKDSIYHEITKIEELLKDEEIKKFQSIEEDKKYFYRAKENLVTFKKNLTDFFDTNMHYIEFEFPPSLSENQILLKSCFEDSLRRIKNDQSVMRKDIDDAITDLEELTISDKKWNNYFEDMLENFIQYLKIQNWENLLDESNKINKLKSELLEIELNIEPIIKSLTEALKKLQIERDSLLKLYCDKNRELRDNRISTCEKVNQYNKNIHIEVLESYNLEAIKEYLYQNTIGQNIHKKQIDLLIEKYKFPAEICNVKTMNFALESCKEISITANTISGIIGKIRGDYDNINLNLDPISKFKFDLEIIYPLDCIKLTLYDENNKKFKDIKRFSAGEQVGAILNLLLTSSNKPLIIDQPEEELDWNYITIFIEKLKDCKSNNSVQTRQFIFVTHNQNITILGDSEKIIKVQHVASEDEQIRNHGSIVAQGGIERERVKGAVLALEGGEEAFLKRLNKYGISR